MGISERTRNGAIAGRTSQKQLESFLSKKIVCILKFLQLTDICLQRQHDFYYLKGNSGVSLNAEAAIANNAFINSSLPQHTNDQCDHIKVTKCL